MSDIAVASTPFEPGSAAPEGTIPLCVPEIHGNEWKYVKECLDSNWVSSAGPFVNRFERAVADYVKTRYAVATVNGTAALHVALLVAGIQPNDEVLVPALTFVAPVNAVRYAGAWPVFIDAEPDYWQMDPRKVADFLAKECRWSGKLINKSTGRQVKAILPVHILGHPVDMEPIIEVARRFELTVIEDATESLGARYQGQCVGRLGDLACFSFNGNKIITTGGGGMITTESSTLAERARYLTTQAKDNPVEYVHNEIGYNYRLTNVQAAIGCAQMEVLDEYVARKREILSKYREAFRGLRGIKTQAEAPGCLSICWLSTITIDASQPGPDSRQFMKHLAEQGIQSRPLWHPIATLPPYRDCQSYQVEVAQVLYRDALSLPSSVGLTEADQARVIDVVQAYAQSDLMEARV